jgi:hypothetical protein
MLAQLPMITRPRAAVLAPAVPRLLPPHAAGALLDARLHPAVATLARCCRTNLQFQRTT